MIHTEESHSLSDQVGGSHYKNLPIQPGEFCHVNGLTLLEGNVIKYVTRWRSKNGLEDLRKARHCIQIIIDVDTKWDSEPSLWDKFIYTVFPVPFVIDPMEYVNQNNIPPAEREIILSLCRSRCIPYKNRSSHLYTAIDHLDRLIMGFQVNKCMGSPSIPHSSPNNCS